MHPAYYEDFNEIKNKIWSMIDNAIKDNSINAIALTSEQEGIGIAAGAYLGGSKAVLLMQSSGVGNCINQLSLIKHGQFPFLTIISSPLKSPRDFENVVCPFVEFSYKISCNLYSPFFNLSKSISLFTFLNVTLSSILHIITGPYLPIIQV